MHHSTKTSKPARFMLAIGLTIITQLTAVGPSQPASARGQTEPLAASAVCQQPAPVGPGSLSSPSPAAGVAQPAVCDRCRAICARNCTSYACIACAKTVKCRSTVQACVRTKRRS